ncbi:hypothetical protein [Streptomyces sp. NPDC058045]|uniref:SCO2583 family membrane protein n=1 Tax=Streptomyces sp. NPDC058045 TaxID=3346311 RepID=UPI0036E3C8BD
MGGPGDPPDGPEGASGGGEDEYGPVVFDESFVRAAHLQESSAQERVTDHAPAVRPRSPRRGFSWQALILVVLIAAAFGTAVYMGVNRPYQPPLADRVEPLRMTVIPLAPPRAVPGADRAADLYRRSPAARFASGAAGITPPARHRTDHFTDSQVTAAATITKDYLYESSLDSQVVGGTTVQPVRALIDPQQHTQFDHSFRHPAADGRHAPTGWLTRVDRATAVLTGDGIRVRGTIRLRETRTRLLEVSSDHTFVYALRPAHGEGRVSLLTVRREMVFRFDPDDLRLHRAELVSATVQAGPLSCSVDSADALRPLLAGEKAKPGGPSTATDPYATGGAAELCGSLALRAQPAVPGD